MPLGPKYYWDFVEILCKSNAMKTTVNAFVDYFEKENPNFDRYTFETALEKCQKNPHTWVKSKSRKKMRHP